MKERLISLLLIALIGGLGAWFLASTYLEELDVIDIGFSIFHGG